MLDKKIPSKEVINLFYLRVKTNYIKSVLQILNFEKNFINILIVLLYYVSLTNFILKKLEL